MRRFLRELFEPPDATCPYCGRVGADVGRRSVVNRLRLPWARLGANLCSPVPRVEMECADCRRRFLHLHPLPRVVVGYHGCPRDFAARLVRGTIRLEEWRPSENEYDWLGKGIYFWEHAPNRAWEWATERYGADGAVVGVRLRLGRCLDLADTEYVTLLRQTYEDTLTVYSALGRALPKNGGRDSKSRKLDRLIIEKMVEALEVGTGGARRLGNYQSIRCPFEEGETVYPGAMIRTQSHVQIAVRDVACLAPPVCLVGR